MIRFRVTRTSNCSVVYEMDQQPCEEAFADGEGWFLLIESLEALEKFIRKYGDVVISMTEKPTFWRYTMPTENDPVNHPDHYTKHPSGIECIQITEHMNFCLGNAMKYIWRAGLKGDVLQDLEKAKWYLEREIARLKAKE